MVYGDNKSFISGGALKQASTTGVLVQNSDEIVNQNVQEWTQGFLVGVDSLFLGCQSSATWDSGEIKISICMEVTTETSSVAASTALALSQQ